MNSRGPLKEFLISFLGVFALCAPFLYLQLSPDFQKGTVLARWGVDYAAKFFSGTAAAIFLLALILFAFFKARDLRFQQKAHSKKKSTTQSCSCCLTSFLYHLEEKRTGQAVLLTLLILFGFVFARQQVAMDIAVRLGICMILATGLNMAIGMAGVLVLGYAGFYALGAYLFALGLKYLGWTGWVDWWIVILPIFFIGMGLGWIVGLPSLKLRGDYLALVTLGFAEAFRELIRNLSEITGGDKGFNIPLSSKFHAFGFLSSAQTAYFIVLLCLSVTLIVVYRIYHSSIGRAWEAIRQDELAANAMGVPVVQMKLLAFALSAGFGAVAGVLYAAYIGFIDPTAASLEQSILILAMVILGGLGNIQGVLIGSLLLFLIPELLRSYIPQLADYRLFFFGVVMVLMMLFRPQGLLPNVRKTRACEAN